MAATSAMLTGPMKASGGSRPVVASGNQAPKISVVEAMKASQKKRHTDVT